MEEEVHYSDSPLIKTGADKLYELVKSSKEVSMAAAAKQLGVTLQTVEAWSNFLEEDGFVVVKYKFTTPYVTFPDSPVKVKSESKQAGIGDTELEFAALKGELDGVHDLLDRAAEQKLAGEFGVLKETYELLLPKLKSVHYKLLDRAAVTPQKKVQLNDSLNLLDPLMQSAVEEVRKGKFDFASIAYAKLYAKTKELVDELNQLYDQINTLEKVQEPNDYKDLLEKAYELMADGHVEEAKQLYEKLKFAHENLAKSFIEKKREMEDDLVKLNRDLARNVDKVNLQKLSDEIRRINILLQSAYTLLKKGNFEAAQEYYLAIRHEYGQLPPGFHEDKKALQERILGFYSDLSKQREKIINSKYADAARQIGSLAKEAGQLLKDGNTDGAISLYSQIRQVYSKLPRGFMKEKAQMQARILGLYGALNTIYTEDSLKKLTMMSSEIVSLLQSMRGQTERGQLDDAESTYEHLKDVYKQIPKGFLHEETSLQNQIVQAYESYLKRAKQLGARSTATMLQVISKLLDQGERQFKQTDNEAANQTYLKVIELYNSLPTGLPEQKRQIREKALRLYKELISTTNTRESFEALHTATTELSGNGQEKPQTLPQPAPILKDMQGNDSQEAKPDFEPAMLSDTGLLEDTDATLDELHKKIEELKSLTRATVRLPQ